MSTDLLATLLKQSFGFDQFRPGQQQAISQLLLGRSSLAIFPTGSGKSSVISSLQYSYQI